jgi:hypothetical protein
MLETIWGRYFPAYIELLSLAVMMKDPQDKQLAARNPGKPLSTSPLLTCFANTGHFFFLGSISSKQSKC